jgi:DNA gyrase/topoisomerase IV subunit A
MTRGRPKILEHRINTSVSLTQDDVDFIRSLGKENSEFFRELIAEKKKSMESPVGKLEREIAEKEKHIEEEQLLVQMMKTRLAEEREKEAQKQQEIEEKEENEIKFKEFILSRVDFIVNHKRPIDFLNYLVEVFDLPDTTEAQRRVLNTLVEAGHPIERVKKIKMMKGI